MIVAQAGSTKIAAPNANYAEVDIGVLGNVVKVTNISTMAVHVRFFEVTAQAVTNTGFTVGPSETVYLSRPLTARYGVAYSAGNASAGVHFTPLEVNS